MVEVESKNIYMDQWFFPSIFKDLNLMKSTYGSSPTQLHHKIGGKKH
jgi:hypothetical protein